MKVVAHQIGDRGTQGRDLRERQIDKDYAPLDDVNAQIGVDSREDQAGHEGGKEKLGKAHGWLPPRTLTRASMSVSKREK